MKKYFLLDENQFNAVQHLIDDARKNAFSDDDFGKTGFEPYSDEDPKIHCYSNMYLTEYNLIAGLQSANNVPDGYHIEIVKDAEKPAKHTISDLYRLINSFDKKDGYHGIFSSDLEPYEDSLPMIMIKGNKCHHPLFGVIIDHNMGDRLKFFIDTEGTLEYYCDTIDSGRFSAEDIQEVIDFIFEHFDDGESTPADQQEDVSVNDKAIVVELACGEKRSFSRIEDAFRCFADSALSTMAKCPLEDAGDGMYNLEICNLLGLKGNYAIIQCYPKGEYDEVCILANYRSNENGLSEHDDFIINNYSKPSQLQILQQYLDALECDAKVIGAEPLPVTPKYVVVECSKKGDDKIDDKVFDDFLDAWRHAKDYALDTASFIIREDLSKGNPSQITTKIYTTGVHQEYDDTIEIFDYNFKFKIRVKEV